MNAAAPTPEAMPPVYDPREVESRWYPLWEEAGVFTPDPASPKPSFSMVLPPPNVTGRLHMGHALNATLQDWILRYRRMAEFETLWVPGCDHAGIATQNVVERELGKEGKSRQNLGREEFLARVWAWKEEHGSAITRQLRTLGASCDWSRERFTMDAGLSRAVREVFVRLYREGLIYQGDYLINWCPRCRTALSDIEVQHRPVAGKFTYIRYPAEGGGEGVVVATTRPETLLGDTAVAVHPEDPRYTPLLGRRVVLPLLKRSIPVIADSMVDREFGTGAVKITPAHDFNDFAAGARHGLPRVNVLNPDGTMNDNAGPYAGLDRFEARRRVVEDLEREGLLVKVETHEHNVGHCYRCDTVVEPYFSRQWFVRMKPLAEPALAAVAEGKTRFTPESWRAEYERWLSGIQDWCISRQIWWGHRIPVFICSSCGKADAYREDPAKCPSCGGPVAQDPDVLDTWFSSALWPFSTLGWPEETSDLARWYPTSVLVTSWDILFFWVARMMMMGLHFMGEVPFREVYVHSLLADEEGKKMSKSRGNVVDPMDLVREAGVDALRFTLASLETRQRYVALASSRLEASRNFLNKLYNAVRFFVMAASNLPRGAQEAVRDPQPPSPQEGREPLEDRWIHHRLSEVAGEARAHAEGYRAAEFAHVLYHFTWHEVCDWYLEAVKPRLYGEGGEEERARAVRRVRGVLSAVLRLLHPLIPFLTEELAARLEPEGGFLVRRPYPRPEDFLRDEEAAAEFRFLQEAVTAVRTARSELNVPPSARVRLSARKEGGFPERLAAHAGLLRALARVERVEPCGARPPRTAAAVLAGGELYLHLEGLIDLEAEARRQEKELSKLEGYAKGLESKLGNRGFRAKAPPEVVEGEREKLRQAKEKIGRIRRNLEALKG